MYSNIVQCRYRGVRRSGRELGADQGIGGAVNVHTVGAYRVMVIKKWGNPGSPDLLPPLYEPVLVAMARDRIQVRGWQRASFDDGDDAAYVQEWTITIVDKYPPRSEIEADFAHTDPPASP